MVGSVAGSEGRLVSGLVVGSVGRVVVGSVASSEGRSVLSLVVGLVGRPVVGSSKAPWPSR